MAGEEEKQEGMTEDPTDPTDDELWEALQASAKGDQWAALSQGRPDDGKSVEDTVVEYEPGAKEESWLWKDGVMPQTGGAADRAFEEAYKAQTTSAHSTRLFVMLGVLAAVGVTAVKLAVPEREEMPGRNQISLSSKDEGLSSTGIPDVSKDAISDTSPVFVVRNAPDISVADVRAAVARLQEEAQRQPERTEPDNPVIAAKPVAPVEPAKPVAPPAKPIVVAKPVVAPEPVLQIAPKPLPPLNQEYIERRRAEKERARALREKQSK